jgi:hypothetical protein
MKLECQSEEVLSTQGTETTFKIEASAKAFHILSDKLYSDKIGAVIRELSTNAYDSHVAAGCGNKPFIVHLPSTLKPEFYVRDYGVGLEKNEIPDIYSTYFFSSKIQSNDYVGCLGLGSKSPFAYTNNFTVEAYKDGKVSIWSMFLKDGLPTSKLLGESDTTEPNGLKVSLAVKNTWDAGDFVQKAGRVYKYFKTKPLFYGSPLNEDLLKIDYSLKTDEWGFRTHGDKEINCVMGNCHYIINARDLDSHNIKFLRFLLDNKIDIFCKIGEVDITPSREALEYTQRTIATIQTKLDLITKAAIEELQKKIDKCVTRYDLCVYVREMSYSLRQLLGHGISNGEITFNRKPLTELPPTEKPVNNQIFQKPIYEIDPKNPAARILVGHEAPQMFLSCVTKTFADRCRYSVSTNTIEYTSRQIFVVNDTDKDIKSRVSAHLRLGGTNAERAYVLEFPAKEFGLKEFCEIIGLDEKSPLIIQASAIPVYKRQSSGAVDRKAPSRVLRFNQYQDETYCQNQERKRWWEDVDIVLSKPHFYVGVLDGRIILDTSDENNVLPHNLLPIIDAYNYLENKKLKPEQILKTSIGKMLKENATNLNHFLDEVKKSYELANKNRQLETAFAQNPDIRTNLSLYTKINDIYITKLQGAPDGKFKSFCKQTHEVFLKYKSDKLPEVKRGLELLGIKPDITNLKVYSIHDAIGEMRKDYPMLSLINDFTDNKCINHIIDYVKLVDSTRGVV